MDEDASISKDDQEMAAIRTEFTGHRIFRAIRPCGELGEWVATLHDPEAGVDATVMCPTADALRAELIKEGERAARKRQGFR